MIRSGFAYKFCGGNIGWWRAGAFVALLLSFLTGAFSTPTSALIIELDDVAPDRIERQRAFSRGTLPNSVPDIETLRDRLAEKGLVEGTPVLIRIFKLESELELWMQKGDTFVLQGNYPICHWTGSLGPKLREGDKQSPEGLYTIGSPQMRHLGRWRQAFNLGFPNLHDKTLQRTGSYILVHGGCSSTGCYAMTGAAQQEIYRLAGAALRKGQDRIQVHVFPFRMTEARLAEYADSPWASFWRDLKAGYDAFEEARMPPRIGVCGRRYVVAAAKPGELEDGTLGRVDPQKAAALGFDPVKCQIDPPKVASVEEPSSGSPLSMVDQDESRGARAVFRVETRQVAVGPREETAPDARRQRPTSKKVQSSGKREQLREKRRAYRAALVEAYSKTVMTPEKRALTP